MKSTLVVNLFGGPGTGKSTTAAGTFSILKNQGVNCEIATEFAKDVVWDNAAPILGDTLYVFGEQFHRLWRLIGKVDVVLTDAPILLAPIYYEGVNPYFLPLVLDEHDRMDTLNVMLKRVKPFQPAGRLQDEAQARELDYMIEEMLNTHEIPYQSVFADSRAPAWIAKWIEERKAK